MQQRAFTLIELLVVIIILAVMTSVIVPAYSQFADKARFDATAVDIQDAFAHARERAVANDTVVTLSYDPQSETFVVTSTPPPPPTDQPTTMLIGPNGEPVNLSSMEAPLTTQLEPQYTITNFMTGQQASGTNTSEAPQQGNRTVI